MHTDERKLTRDFHAAMLLIAVLAFVFPFLISIAPKISASSITQPGAVGRAQFCGTAAACSATAQQNIQLVYGSVALTSGTPSTATVTGISPAFASNTAYRCTLTNGTTAANGVSITYVSGSSFTITGPNTVTDVISYICAGTV